jgi:hypothetical protein
VRPIGDTPLDPVVSAAQHSSMPWRRILRGLTLSGVLSAVASGANVSCLASNPSADGGAQGHDGTDQSPDADRSDSGDASSDTNAAVDSTPGDDRAGDDEGCGDDSDGKCVPFSGTCTEEGEPCCKNLICTKGACIHIIK